MNYSPEQITYIEYTERKDTKLLACAGSGKTRCIIARMEKLITKNIYKDNEILMLTFSRPTQNDFINRMVKYGATHINAKMVRTIDSFAKKVIDPNNQVDVSTLSYTFLMFLQDTEPELIKAHPKLENIKCIFVDEAQDLNDTQFKIISLLKKKLHCCINLIGDPNQNIYQFRKSSDKYFVDFKAQTFELTTNYRSHRHIVEFSTHIRPYNNVKVNSIKATKNDKVKPIFIGHSTDEMFEKYLTEIIDSLININKADLSTIAILAPVRGYLRTKKKQKSKGLCFVANVLAKHKIPFVQFYEESSDNESNKVKYREIPGKINLLTYTGSKGLEWDHVILVDADTALINKRFFNEEKHNHDQFLLYVACTRAIKNLYIFAPYTYTDNVRNFNPWFKVVPKQFYYVHDNSRFKYGNLDYTDYSDADNKITKIISKMTEIELYYLSSKINIVDEHEFLLYDTDYTKSKPASSIFLGKLTELIFKFQYSLRWGIEVPRLHLIEKLIKNSNIIICNNKDFMKWLLTSSFKTWDDWDKIKHLMPKGANSFADKLNKQIPLQEYTFTNDDFFGEFVLKHYNKIKETYAKYRSIKSWHSEANLIDEVNKVNENLVQTEVETLFFLLVVMHSIETKHYFHIDTNGEKFRSLLDDFVFMFEDMNNYVLNMDEPIFTHFNLPVSEFEMEGEMDAIDKYEHIHEIKCVKNINLTHKLQVLMYNHMWHQRTGDTINYILSFYNFLEGKKRVYKVEIKYDDMENIIKLFQKIGNTKEYKKQEEEMFI